jgi:hypothetical protein
MRAVNTVSRILAVAAASAALASLAAADAPYPSQPGAEIVQGGADAGFLELFSTLAAQGPVLAKFTEYRFFPFRTAPVVLQGEMRFSPERGLSLHYLRPEESVVIADEQGLILRDASGRSRVIQKDPHLPDIGGILVPILRFESAPLFKAFHVHGALSGLAWRVDFVPRSAEVARWVGTVTVEGSAGTVARIEFRRSSTQRVEIHLEPPATGVSFGAEERKRYFR